IRPRRGRHGSHCSRCCTRRGFGTRTGELGLPTRYSPRSEHPEWVIWCDNQPPCTPRSRSVGVSRARGSSAAGVLGRWPLRTGPPSEPAMMTRTGGIVRLCVAGLLATFPFCTAPHASAVTPPAVDDSMLPKPGPPAPPRPTEQRERCVAAPPTSADTPDAAQLKGRALQQAWKFTRGAGQTVAVIDTGVARHRL